MLIRPYEAKDAEAVRSICLATCSDPFLLENTDVLWAKYADYYINEEPETCFVAEEDGRVLGYLLCSTRPGLYRARWNSHYRSFLKGKGLKAAFLQRFTEFEIRRMARKGYPAHLHIDILPEAQRRGIGSALVDTLMKKLSDEGIPGVYLGCASSNPSGNAFYRKYGFALLEKIPGCNLYGLKC